MSATLFVSDLHLCPTRPAIARLFLDFLAHQARQADALYILGDLFEYWAGDDTLDDSAEPFNLSICTALKQLADSGTRIFFIAGNRDFLIGPEFSTASGVILLSESQRIDIAGTPTLLLHGDTLCTDDLAYQEFRATVRTEAWRKTFLALSLAERKTRIEALRVQSEQVKRSNSAAIMDVNAGTVAAVLRSHCYPRMIHGHTHRPALHTHTIDGHICERWVLGDWYDSGSYLHCDAGGCRALPLTRP